MGPPGSYARGLEGSGGSASPEGAAAASIIAIAANYAVLYQLWGLLFHQYKRRWGVGSSVYVHQVTADSTTHRIPPIRSGREKLMPSWLAANNSLCLTEIIEGDLFR